MAWITLTTADLEDYLVAAQVTALRQEALGAGQADPFADILAGVVAKVRAAIASHSTNDLDADTTTYPAELKGDVALLVAEPMLGRLGIALTDDQVRQVKRADDTLLQIATGKRKVTTPANPIAPPVQSGDGLQVVSRRARQPSTSDLSGL